MKKTRLISIAVAAFTAAQLLLAPAGVSAAGSVQGIVVSENTSAYSSITTEQGLKDYANAYKDTHVTDYVIDVFSKNIVTPSEVTGLDRVDVLTKAFKAAGIYAWLAFDMNDTYTGTIASNSLSKFYKGTPNIKRVTYNSALNTTYHSAMNYSNDAVRTYMLDIIKQALTKYDCYGIELDFQNAIWMWAVGGEYNGLSILDGFMRKVDRLVKTFEITRGHEIKVSVRCASDLETNYELGIDVATWVADGILDRVVPTASGNLTDFDVPVRVWTALMHPYGGEVVPSIQAAYAASEKGLEKGATAHTIETLRGAAANWFSQGVDKVYMNGLKSNNAYNDALASIGSYDTLMTLDRKTVLTYNDVNPFWSKSNAQLPKSASKNATMTLRVPVGDVPAGATVTLRFTGSSLTTAPTVYINSTAAKSLGIGSVPADLSAYSGASNNYKLYTYTVPAEILHELYLVVEITPTTDRIEVNYMDVVVDVE